MLTDLTSLLAFLIASVILTLTPGPAVVYIVARTIAQGRAQGFASALGVALGNLTNAMGAAFGLAALFAVSSAAFTVVKWAGAAYLVYLGVRLWRSTPAIDDAVRLEPPQQWQRVFRDGFLVALLNPKTTLFFAAFVPQFLSVQSSMLFQTVLFGCLFVTVALVTDALYVLAASVIAPKLSGAARYRVWGNRLAGTSFIGLGILTALGTRPTR